MKPAQLLYVLLLTFICLGINSNAQVNEELREDLSLKLTADQITLLNTADKYFVNREYLMALPYYDTLANANKDNLYLQYLLGVCYAYDAANQRNSEGQIEKASTIKDKLLDYDYFLGKALLENEKYDEAISKFEDYLKNPIDNELKLEVLRQIKICINAKESNNKFTLAKISNIGAPINTKDAEYCPLLPSDERFMVFTYRGERSTGGKQIVPGKKDEKKGIYFEDVLISYKGPRGEWSEPVGIDAINTNGHDAAIFLSQDGQRLFIYRNVKSGNGDIYESRMDGAGWSKPEKVKGINSSSWEGSVCLSPDQQTIYFSSERPGGLGGRDLYYAQLMPDGSWGNIKNMGPGINTRFDEDAPFVHSDGKTMFFASNGHKTIGGYDIFKSELKNDKWSDVTNLGKPMNTVGDDKFYFVSSDGQRGYYSSAKASGFGQQDIYKVEPGMFGKATALVLLSGKITYDDKPVDAEIKVISKLYKRDYISSIKSNARTGDYLVNLPSGNEFEVVVKYKDAQESKDISTALVDSFARLEMNIDLMSKEYLLKHPIKIDSAQLRSDDVTKAGMSYEDFIIKYGDKKVDSIDYRVQIGAYRSIENFNYSCIIGLPKVRRKIYKDGITRFTLGSVETINEAIELCDKAKKNGVKDAFIIAIYREERIFFNQLINSGLLDK